MDTFTGDKTSHKNALNSLDNKTPKNNHSLSSVVQLSDPEIRIANIIYGIANVQIVK